MIRSIVICAALVFVLAATKSVCGQSSEGSRRFGPLYDEGRPPPPTDENGWPADWDERPHLSLDVFGVTSEFNATREYRNGSSAYGERPYGRDRYDNGPYGSHGYGNGPNGARGYVNGPIGPRGYGNGWGNRDLFSSDSGFALRYGHPGTGPAYDAYPPSFGYPGPAYGVYPSPYGYGAYGRHPAYYDYGHRYRGDRMMVEPPGQYLPYFGW